jgi:23S rRNA pseudouridine1911/1915/1917 synthase
LEVLFEDNHLIAVNKPAGIGVQGDNTGDVHLLQMVAAYLQKKYNKPGAAFVGLIHRIDRPVSGVVLLARTSKALERMNAQFREKRTTKIYHAISKQLLSQDTGTLTHYLSKDAKTHRALTYLKPKPGAKECILQFRLLKSVNGFNLYEVNPQTGRFHQIRAQFAKSGAALLGDVKYGADAPLPDRSIGLHARSLAFEHPVTKTNVIIEAPYPASGAWQRF